MEEAGGDEPPVLAVRDRRAASAPSSNSRLPPKPLPVALAPPATSPTNTTTQIPIRT